MPTRSNEYVLIFNGTDSLLISYLYHIVSSKRFQILLYPVTLWTFSRSTIEPYINKTYYYCTTAWYRSYNYSKLILTNSRVLYPHLIQLLAAYIHSLTAGAHLLVVFTLHAAVVIDPTAAAHLCCCFAVHLTPTTSFTPTLNTLLCCSAAVLQALTLLGGNEASAVAREYAVCAYLCIPLHPPAPSCMATISLSQRGVLTDATKATS